jgi:hypothetical protein
MFTAATFSMLLTINADAFPAALQNPFPEVAICMENLCMSSSFKKQGKLMDNLTSVSPKLTSSTNQNMQGE